MLSRILYVSRVANGVNHQEVCSILTKSRSNNTKKDVTGMLFYGSDFFIQVLEGQKAAVLDLYKKISKDKRHTDCFLIYSAEVDHRDYPDWSMGYFSEDTLQDVEVKKMLGHSDFNIYETPAVTILSILGKVKGQCQVA